MRRARAADAALCVWTPQTPAHKGHCEHPRSLPRSHRRPAGVPGMVAFFPPFFLRICTHKHMHMYATGVPTHQSCGRVCARLCVRVCTCMVALILRYFSSADLVRTGEATALVYNVLQQPHTSRSVQDAYMCVCVLMSVCLCVCVYFSSTHALIAACYSGHHKTVEDFFPHEFEPLQVCKSAYACASLSLSTFLSCCCSF